MDSHNLRAGSANHGCLCSIMILASPTPNMGALRTSCFPFPTAARQLAAHLLIRPPFHSLSPIKDHLPPSRFFNFQIVSRLYIGVLPLSAVVLNSAGRLLLL